MTSSPAQDLRKEWDKLRRALSNHRNNYAKRHGVSGAAGVPYKPYKYEVIMSFLDGMRGEDRMDGNLEGSRLDDISDEVGLPQLLEVCQ